MGRNLGAFKTHVEIEVKDKNGKVICKRRYVSRSWVRNFLKVIRDFMTTTMAVGIAGTGAYPSIAPVNFSVVKDINGADANLNTRLLPRYAGSYPTSIMGVDAPVGTDSFGIVVGSGTNPVTPDDYNLQAKYQNGSGLGYLLYDACSVEDVAVSGNTVSFRIIRTFTNQHTGLQNINEIGIIARYIMTHYDATTTVYFLIARDVLPSPISVPAGATLTVRYIISHTI